MGTLHASCASRRRGLVTLVAGIAVVLTLPGCMGFMTREETLQKKIEHRYAIADPQFRREISVMLGPTILPGNRVEILNNGDEIFPAMLAAIAAARKTITFETYIYWSDDIGQKFADALSERARAGVQVKVIIDWAGSLKMERRLIDQVRDSGAEVRLYRPLRWYNFDRLNNRTHRKLLVIDGRVGFTGGVGIADLWEGHAQDPEHWRDIHFRIEGPVVWQFQAAFNDNWIKTSGTLLNGEAYFPPLGKVGDMDAHMLIASPAGGGESMHLMYLMAIAAAERSIDLQAAYFVPDELIIKALIAARQRGVRVRVMVPGKHTDTDTVRLASKAQWGPMLAAGIKIHEYLPTMLHSKMLIVDRIMVSVGSANFDPRSFRLNDEASLNVYDSGFAAQMTRVFEADLEHTRPYDLEMWQRRPRKERLLEKFVLPIRSQL